MPDRWVPKVGDRVRVNVDPACPRWHLGNGKVTPTRTLIDLIRTGEVGGAGYQGANGAVGKVVRVYVEDDGEADGHVYYVNDTVGGRFDKVDDFFTAAELEPVA